MIHSSAFGSLTLIVAVVLAALRAVHAERPTNTGHSIAPSAPASLLEAIPRPDDWDTKSPEEKRKWESDNFGELEPYERKIAYRKMTKGSQEEKDIEKKLDLFPWLDNKLELAEAGMNGRDEGPTATKVHGEEGWSAWKAAGQPTDDEWKAKWNQEHPGGERASLGYEKLAEHAAKLDGRANAFGEFVEHDLEHAAKNALEKDDRVSTLTGIQLKLMNSLKEWSAKTNDKMRDEKITSNGKLIDKLADLDSYGVLKGQMDKELRDFHTSEELNPGVGDVKLLTDTGLQDRLMGVTQAYLDKDVSTSSEQA